MQITFNDTMFKSMPSQDEVLQKKKKKKTEQAAGICTYINYAIEDYALLRGQILFLTNKIIIC